MIERKNAVELLGKHVKNENMLRHCLASEAVMQAIAQKLSEDESSWGLAGLLHDIDVEITNGDSLTHGTKSREILNGLISEEAICAIEAHNEATGVRKRQTKFDHALAAGETITGLITATALVYPDKKIASVKVKSITKRMKEKLFAASVKRENIMECEKLGMSLDEFAEISLEAMKSISDELGL